MREEISCTATNTINGKEFWHVCCLQLSISYETGLLASGNSVSLGSSDVNAAEGLGDGLEG